MKIWRAGKHHDHTEWEWKLTVETQKEIDDFFATDQKPDDFRTAAKEKKTVRL